MLINNYVNRLMIDDVSVVGDNLALVVNYDILNDNFKVLITEETSIDDEKFCCIIIPLRDNKPMFEESKFISTEETIFDFSLPYIIANNDFNTYNVKFSSEDKFQIMSCLMYISQNS